MKHQIAVAAALIVVAEMGLAAETPFVRLVPSAYGDGISSFAGAERPNPRVISNMLCAQLEALPDPRRLSDFVWQWGQFIDHDLTFTPTNIDELEAIPVTGFADPLAPEILFYRSAGTGSPREQVNEVTPFLDGSMVYGSDETRTAALRTFSGGLLKTSDGGLLPYNTEGLPNDIGGAPASEGGSYFVAGDVRCNEQPGLTAMHTLFVREHNRTAAKLALDNPDWDDQRLYETARGLIVITIQNITFSEYLPALLGAHAPEIVDFEEPVEASLANSFVAAFFRLGHTQVSPTIRRVLADGSEDPEKPSHSMRELFFDPTIIAAPGEIEVLLRGLSTQVQQATDLAIIDDLRNALFGAPGSGGMDLASLNIQRGRDHGLPDFNTLRGALGLPRLTEVPPALTTVYSSVDDIDPWIGALSEAPLPGSSVGETISRALVQQFGALAHFTTPDGISIEEAETALAPLSEVIVRNTGIAELPTNVFFVPPVSAAAPELACMMTADGPSLSWSAMPNMRYTIVASENLDDWDSMGVMAASHPGVLTFSSPMAEGLRQFFSVKMVPSTTGSPGGDIGL